MTKFSRLLGLSLTFTFSGFAQDYSGELETLQRQAEGFAAFAAAGSSDALIVSEYRDFSNNFGSLQNSLRDNNLDQSTQILRRWLARTKNEDVKKSLTVLLERLEAAQQKQFEARTKSLDDLWAKITLAVTTVDSVETIEDLREELSDFQQSELNRGSGISNQKLQDRINRASNELQQWAQVLAAETDGEYGQALQYLANLRRSSERTRLVPAETINARYAMLLDRLLAEEGQNSTDDSPLHDALGKIVAGVKTPEDAAEALGKVNELMRYSQDRDHALVQMVSQRLNEIVRLQSSLASGFVDRALRDRDMVSSLPRRNYDPKLMAQLDALALRLRLQALAQAFELGDLGAPEPNEGLGNFLQRSAKAAFEKKDWPRLAALLSIYADVSGGMAIRPAPMQTGVQAFLAGTRLEAAGLPAEALREYAACIAANGSYVPRAEAAAAVARLRQIDPTLKPAPPVSE